MKLCISKNFNLYVQKDVKLVITEEEKIPLFLVSLPPKGKKGEGRDTGHKRDIYTRVAIGVFNHAWIRICLNIVREAGYI